MSSRSRTSLLLTELALSNLAEIRDYFIREWGRKTADRYLDDLEAGLQRIQDQPAVLRSLPDLNSHLRFYRIRQHLFVCDVRPGSIVVLTVIHDSMDIPARLAELQPTLAAEVALLHKQLEASEEKKRLAIVIVAVTDTRL